ncbi:hypothetical protein [Actinoplanes derwentensis]|uniref:Uncharacterized protein n=1 Tax=Actinoplanes derwentensis TaxID=113562 RepID=A0A1H1XP52_9ACTN|nr:hypothetical protein [Actinoplanes derwentensis]GID87714.1 hypothetical protein Ade03nite_66380 [Actinoplanes derwentensis]SDT10619.1 hypothetical protein SAMN04489716_2523 [Actinoplanes derwentensis]
MSVAAALVFFVVVAGRFLLPLAIPYFPLPAVIGCLVLDGVDQTIFQSFGYDPPGYQSYDKAMDVYYLSIAYLSTLRNWTNQAAFEISRFLFFYRLAGALLFEVTQARWLLLAFPNVFEYFFIAYETIRSRGSPVTLMATWWISLAGVIWVVVKLPQEWWLHVAQLDLTDEISGHQWILGLIVALLAGISVLFQRLIRPRLPPADWDWRVRPEPLPEEIDEPHEQDAWRTRYDAVWSWNTFEKALLLSLVCGVFGQMLPDFTGSTTELFAGVAVAVVMNAAISLAVARRNWTIRSTGLAFATRLLLNVALATIGDWLLGRQMDGYDTLFFLTMISLITTLHDRWRPVHHYRRLTATAG